MSTLAHNSGHNHGSDHACCPSCPASLLPSLDNGKGAALTDADIEDAMEWEHYKGGKFWHHMVAGGLAGVSEHLLMFPFDTIKVLLTFT